MRQASRIALLLLLASPAFAHTDGDCAALPPDLSSELAAMRAAPKRMPAITGLGQVTGLLEPGQRYDGVLVSQEAMRFPVPPARAREVAGAKAGIFHFAADKPGRYRISLTSRHWIDVLINGKAIDSVGHRGHTGCSLLHKVVEFDLPVSRVVLLQLSGATESTVGIVITGPA